MCEQTAHATYDFYTLKQALHDQLPFNGGHFVHNSEWGVHYLSIKYLELV